MADQEQDNQQQDQQPQQPQEPQNINLNPMQAVGGMNTNSILRQVKGGQLTYALNAQIENFDGGGITYQNEGGNTLCFNLPEGYVVIGRHFIPEKDKTVWFLVNPITGGSEIGVSSTLDCIYITLVNQSCLNFNINYPIHKSVHKITACGTEIYWTDAHNPRRYIDIDNLPFAQSFTSSAQEPCQATTLSTIDCNKLNIQPNFSIPQITYQGILDGGDIVEGSYQFAIQYTNFEGNPYTSYYSHSNPIPIIDLFKVGPDFNYVTGRSIKFKISNIDTTGLFDYFNVAVIKTINGITSADLVATYQITQDTQTIVYTGTSKDGVSISLNEIFERYVYFDTAEGVTSVQDVLVWHGLTTNERVSYQQIANQITPKWQTYKVPPNSKQFADPLNSANVRGYMRDEIYPLSLLIVLKNGYQSDQFPLIGRSALPSDLEVVNNGDTQNGGTVCDPMQGLPRWQVYNTGSVTDFCPEFIGHEDDSCYEGPYQYGEFGYGESTEQYPCNQAVWGSMQGKQIRHFLFPDNSVTNHHDNQGNIYPIGIRIDAYQIYQLIENSSLTQAQKDQIACIKIVRGDRAANKSIIAKGLLYNVGAYTKDNSNYFFPNYPFNDLREDPFIKGSLNLNLGVTIVSNYNQSLSNGSTSTTLYSALIPAGQLANDGDVLIATYQGQYNGTNNNPQILVVSINNEEAYNAIITASAGTTWTIVSTIKRVNSDTFSISSTVTTFGIISFTGSFTKTLSGIDLTQTLTIDLAGATANLGAGNIGITAISEAITYQPGTGTANPPSPYLDAFSTLASQQRFTFHSPDTSFYQPSLGTLLKLETVEYGLTRSHFVQVKGHAKYKFPSLGSYLTSLGIGIAVGFASATIGVSDNIFNGAAAFTAFEVFSDLIYKLIPRKNFAYQFNSIGYYNNNVTIPNDNGNKVRTIDIGSYLSSGLQGNSDLFPINNYQRESSVYLRTTSTLPFQDTYNGVPSDTSRYTASGAGCNLGFQENPISAYYASIKNRIVDQYGEIYSYPTVDTGFQLLIDLTLPTSQFSQQFYYIFGGDTYINRFAFKRKFPFFLDNRVKFPDDSDVFYDELGNVGHPSYWFSTDITQGNGGSFGLGSLFGVKVNSFDCKDGSFFYDSGKFYLFAYGLPYFYVESQVNVDYRQASNDLAGDFFPHVSNDVPDEWLQEINVPIALDNNYNYNKSFSKQNDENVFTTLPTNFVPNQLCTERYINKAIYSDQQEDPVYYRKNSWLLYHPDSYYDFPLNYGKLIDLEGIENKEIIARFENRIVSYNTLLTVNTSSPQAAYLGNNTLFKSGPPIDFADTDSGYAGTQNKMFIKTEKGHISVDAKRGQIILIPQVSPYFGRRQLKDLAGPEFNMSQFFCENLEFRILRTFPDYPIDNHFNNIGLHGVYDTKYNRLIMTKIDYEVTSQNLVYNPITFQFVDRISGEIIQLGDPNYFCNRSFTLSFNFLTNSWTSFHSYIPNFYVPGPSYFFSGINGSQSSNWLHNRTYTLFNNFYGQIAPYIIEYPFAYKMNDEIVQNVKDYTKVLQYFSNNDYQSFIEVDGVYFNKAWLYNNQQHSGLLQLVMKPKNNISEYLKYPMYSPASKSILVTKSNNFYNYNTFWDVIVNKLAPTFSRDCTGLSIDKVLVQANMDYTSRSFKKAPLMAKDLKVRHILDNQSQYKFVSQFLLAPSQVSYK